MAYSVARDCGALSVVRILLTKLGVVAVAVDGIGIAKVGQVSGDATSLVLTVFVVSAIVCSYGNPMYRFPFSCKPQPQISPA